MDANAPPAQLRRLDAEAIDAAAAALGALLAAAVAEGASLGFLAGLTPEQATRHWRDLAASAQDSAVIVAEDAEGVAGVVVVQPLPAAFQSHRAQVAKLIVHRRARARGIGAALMRAAEDEARRMRRPVLTLMTRRGSASERLYRALGWTLAGVIPHDSLAPDGTPVDGAIWVRRLDAARPDAGGHAVR